MRFTIVICAKREQIVLYLLSKSQTDDMNDKNIIITRLYNSPCGEMIIGSIDGRLCLCDWMANPSRRSRVDSRLSRIFNAGFREGRSAVVEQAIEQLDEYFFGKRSTFDLPLVLAGTEFQEQVWRELLTIPFGTTITYGELANRMAIPDAVRAVANACGANAISVFVPCHRVVGSKGMLTGYAGGIEAKRKLLLIENTSYRKNKY